jgi:hypothetical protein
MVNYKDFLENLPVFKRLALVFLGVFSVFLCVAQSPLAFSALSYDYFALQKQSDAEVKTWMTAFNAKRDQMNRNEQIRFLTKLMQDKPYLFSNPEGEGNGCADGSLHCNARQRQHIQQNPIYRTDGFNCQTLVQMVLALLHAKDFSQFQKNILAVSYGGAGDNQGVHFYNRNHFISLDFNPVNEKLHYLQDVTQEAIVGLPVKTSTIQIDKGNWFASMRTKLLSSQVVQVISPQTGQAMVSRWLDNYPHPFVDFSKQSVSMNYIPKKAFFLGDFLSKVNLAAVEKLPTPSVLEIVRDSKQWLVAGESIEKLIGTPLHVSHLGFLYRDHFLKNEKIFDSINIKKNKKGGKQARVFSVFCHQEKGCDEVMFVHATDVLPADWSFYQDEQDQLQCGKVLPKNLKARSTCNRVQALPFQYYLKSSQYGKYLIINPSILGFHVEQVL